ncbi:hypothetical protein D3M59_10120 [Sphingomonas edaphi]|uniref:Uncharacterized protein n=1 Tax=Sphingomonas edaphi TaxID=2315689 RepID=A0A418PZ81_9SPHN|nr:hypothetical protein D3M59_10120 [Sphingomonas edaphi]
MKNWDASTPELRSMKVHYDVKKNTKARLAAQSSAQNEWLELTLSGTADLCTDGARTKNLNSSKSN